MTNNVTESHGMNEWLVQDTELKYDPIRVN